MENIFTKIYENSLWGYNTYTSDYNGCSGPGSTIEYNKNTYIPFLKKFIVDNNIKNIVDLGCGDFLCGNLIYDDLDISYTGYDIYKKIIDSHSNRYNPSKYNFTHIDFSNNKENIINGDLCILKDVLQHWSINDIYNLLDYLVDNKKFKYILICNCSSTMPYNIDIDIGDFRPLNIDHLPLSKYSPTKIYNYDSKEVSIIEIN